MATIEISSPSSHSQAVYAPATIVANVSVTNYGGAWGYARMMLTSPDFTIYGDILGIRPGVTETLSVTHPLGTQYEGRALYVAAHLYEVTPYGSIIRNVGTPHTDFRIYVIHPWDEDE